MTSLKNKFRTSVVALATVGAVISSAWAKGPSGVSSHVASHSITAAVNHTGNTSKPTISSSNGFSSDNIQSLSVKSDIGQSVQPGGHPHHDNTSVGSSTTGNLNLKSSEAKGPLGQSSSAMRHRQRAYAGGPEHTCRFLYRGGW